MNQKDDARIAYIAQTAGEALTHVRQLSEKLGYIYDRNSFQVRKVAPSPPASIAPQPAVPINDNYQLMSFARHLGWVWDNGYGWTKVQKGKHND